MTLSNLSLRNAKRQARDYLVYFVTVILAAALIYAFNALVFSQEVQELSTKLESLPLIIVLSSIAVVCIIGWLVSYTIRFMLTRRSRELGTYILIGLEHRQVARMFFQENLAVGGVALVIGSLLGNLLFQAMRAILLSMFGAPYALRLSLSLPAVGLTLLYFALIYLLALFKSRKRIRNMKIHDLIYFDRQNEGAVIQKGRSRRRIFAASIVFGVAGTLLLLLGNLMLGLLGAVCIVVFLYGFFLSFSSGVPAYFDTRPERKYRGQTLFVFRTLSAKLATMGIVMATIALLFTATILAEGTGMTFNALFQSRMEKVTAFDLYIGTQNETHLDDYQASIERAIPVAGARRYSVYLGADAQVTDYVSQHTNYYRYYDSDTLMAFSDYAALRAMKGWPAITLEPGHYLIHCTDYLSEPLQDYRQSIRVAGQSLEPAGIQTGALNQNLWDANGHGFILVVPDAQAKACPVSHSALAVMTEAPVSEEQFAALCEIRDQFNGEYDTLYSKADQEASAAAMSALTVFPLYYLSLVLTMTAATILTVQQLSEAGRYRRQFRLLRQLGMDRREMKRALGRQFAIYYAMPALPPLLIGIPFILNLGGQCGAGHHDGPLPSRGHNSRRIRPVLPHLSGVYPDGLHQSETERAARVRSLPPTYDNLCRRLTNAL